MLNVGRVTGALNRNEYQKQKSNVSRERPAHDADNLTSLCDPIV
jgi:hypothetical protein